MSTLLAVTILVALVSYDLAKTALFRPVRVMLARRTPRRLRKVWRCHYCLSHHVAWATLLVFGWYYPFGTRLDPVLTWAVVVVLANPVMAGIDWAIDATDSFKRIFRIEEPPEPQEAQAARAPSANGNHREPALRAANRSEPLRRAESFTPSN